MSRWVIEPVFLHETVNAEQYQNIIKQYIALLEPSELRVRFQQNGAYAHMAASTKEFLKDFLDDRIILWGLWPPRTTDLTTPDFFLWVYIKDHIFQVETASIDHLKELITNMIAIIDQNILKKGFLNMSQEY